MKKTIYRIILLFIIIFTSLISRTEAQNSKKPNIIIILADDLGWGDVGYHGSSIKTPNIDQLAKEGIELNRFYTAAVCSPTRAGILTGRYPDRYGLRGVIPPWSSFGLDTKEVLLPEVLANAGYKNRALIGKWHLGHSSIKYHPLSRGFTHFYGLLNGNLDYFSHIRDGGLDWHDDLKPSYDKGYSTDLLTNEAIQSIKKYNKESPFFLYLAFNAPHSPLQAKEEDLLKYGYDKSKPTFNPNSKEEIIGRGNTKRQTYSAMVTNMDENIGRILNTLKELNIDDNTIVLFHSDNGAALNEGGTTGNLRGHKGTEWEGGVRAPAIIKWPNGFKGGWTSNQVMGYIDIMPTLLDIAGVKSGNKNPLDGLSVFPVLTRKTQNIDRDFYLGSGAIVNKDWKLVEAANASPNMKITEDQFFNISVDASEKMSSLSNHDAYNHLKNEIKKYNTIKPSVKAPPYGEGRKNFVAPKEWTIK